MKLVLSFDDGHELDRRLIEMLDYYGVRATFFVPVSSYGFSHIRMYEGHVLGGHTATHPQDLKLLNAADLYAEVVVSRSKLQCVSHQKVTEFCYPRGRFNDDVKEYVRMAGFLSARTTRVLCTKKAADPFEQDTTVHIHPERKEYEDRYWLEIALEAVAKRKQYVHIWGHADEIDRFGLWQDVESLCNYVAHEHITT